MYSLYQIITEADISHVDKLSKMSTAYFVWSLVKFLMTSIFVDLFVINVLSGPSVSSMFEQLTHYLQIMC